MMTGEVSLGLISCSSAVGSFITYRRFDPLDAAASLSYDKNGSTTSLREESGRIYAYEYDVRDLLVRTTDPLSGVCTYAYDAVQRLEKVTMPLGYETSFTYSDGWEESQRNFSGIGGNRVVGGNSKFVAVSYNGVEKPVYRGGKVLQ